MLYLQNASFGQEGFNTHLMSYTFAVSLSNFLDRDFFFDYEIPCSTPPDYASKPEYKDKFGTLLTAKRIHPHDITSIDVTEQTLGPYESSIAPSRRGPRKLKNEAVTNII